VNIVFVYSSANFSLANNFTWRGEMLHRSIKKTGLHNVRLISSDDFSKSSNNNNADCLSSQLIVIEGSPEIDLLNLIHFWKSRGKIVVVDIPISSEKYCGSLNLPSDGSFSISQIYSNFQNQDFAKIDQSDKFRWGLHLADCILVSSVQQQTRWQSSAPIRIIPEFIDIDMMRDIARFKHESFIIGLIANKSDIDPSLQTVIATIETKFPKVKWLPICDPQLLSGLKPASIITTLPAGFSQQWPGPAPLIDMGIFWDDQIVRGEFYHNVLEFMSLKIPWVLNDPKGYQDLIKYGLMILNNKNWQSSILELVQKTILGVINTEEGYLFSIGHNIEDHIHEIITTFSEIIKIRS
jgi:hypothetical protein